MKKNIIRVALLILFTALLVLCMQKNIFAATEVNRIDITIQMPIVGEKLATDFEVTAEGVDSVNFTKDFIGWEIYELGTYTPVSGDFAEKGKQYIADVTVNISKDYVLSQDCIAYVNGYKAVIGDYTDFTDYSSIHIQMLSPYMAHTAIEKEIAKIEITTPAPVVGEKLDIDSSKYKVKIDDEEILEVNEVEWYSEDYKALSNDIAEDGKKYQNVVIFSIPNKYKVSSDVVVLVNGIQIDAKNTEEFNYAYSGDLDYDYASVSKLFEVKKEEVKDEQQEELNEESKKESIKIKNPKTGDTITKTFIISIISVIGIALTINSIRKENK